MRRLRSMCVSGEGQEDLVERRPAQREVVDDETAARRGDEPTTARPLGCRRRRGTDTRPVSWSTRAGSAPTEPRIRATAGAWSRSRGRASITSRPVCALSSRRRALGDRAAVVDDHDPVGQVVGLVEVLRREHDVGAVGDELAHGLPQRDAAGRVEARRRLVEQQQRAARRRAWRRGRAGGACRRPAAHEPPGGVGELEPLEHVAGPPPGVASGTPEQAGDHLQVLDGRSSPPRRRRTGRPAR